MNEYINDALTEISDKHLNEAIHPKKKTKFYWLGAIAAILAVVFFLSGTGLRFHGTLPEDQYTVSLSTEQRPIRARVITLAAEASQTESSPLANSAMSSAKDFFRDSTNIFLSGTNENRVWTPLGAYMTLAMLAEMTDGSSREQIMEVLGVTHIQSLQGRTAALWESVYFEGADSGCSMANSAWLDSGLNYQQEVMDTLGHTYYASVYQGDMGSTDMNEDIRSWLSNNTGGLLHDAVETIDYDQSTFLALFSTVYFNGKWVHDFSAEENTVALFHGPGGPEFTTFMNDRRQMELYWSGCYSAVKLPMSNGCAMWLILPDEDQTPDTVLEDGTYLEMVTAQRWNSQSYTVNLSVPKFDVNSHFDLIKGLQQLGITDIFDEELADFSASLINAQDLSPYINRVTQANRVVIDESGATAASFTEASGALGFNPNSQIREIDFILDRPFIFVITSADNLPLFIGVVNEP